MLSFRRGRKGALPVGLAAAGGMMMLAIAFGSGRAEQGPDGARLLSGSDDCPVLSDFDENGGVVVYVLGLLYMFVLLAIVCDDYFVDSLEKISEELNLTDDVAGATFMAAGSSAPELFVSFADNVLASEPKSLGVGTIVGSAIFNILIIIGVTAMLAGQVLQLDWRPMIRDSCWYTVSIALLLITMEDEEVSTGESLMLVAAYMGYVLYMWKNEHFMQYCVDPHAVDADVPHDKSKEVELAAAAAKFEEILAADKKAKAQAPKEKPMHHTIDVERPHLDELSPAASLARKTSDPTLMAGSDERTARRASLMSPMLKSQYRAFANPRHPLAKKGLPPGPNGRRGSADVETGGAVVAATEATLADLPPELAVLALSDDRLEPDDEMGSYWSTLEYPRNADLGEKVFFVIAFPLNVAMKLTIPDSRYERFSKPCGYMSCFFMSIVWIGAACHFITEWATRFGCIVGIPLPLMGLTILAAGTSIPDALASVIVAKDGQGNMAVSNAIGSNVFDILLGLGVPYFLANVIKGERPTVDTDDLMVSIIILFGILLAVVGILVFSKWKLYPKVGQALFLLYFIFVAFSYGTSD